MTDERKLTEKRGQQDTNEDRGGNFLSAIFLSLINDDTAHRHESKISANLGRIRDRLITAIPSQSDWPGLQSSPLKFGDGSGGATPSQRGILGRRHSSGESDLAERHNEHQQ